MVGEKQWFEDYAPVSSKPAPTLKEREGEAGIGAKQATTARTTTLTPLQARALERKEKEAVAKEEAAANRARQEVSTFRDNLVPALQDIARVRSILGPTSAGYGSLLKDMPASKANALREAIKTLKANAFLASIAQLKAGSDKGSTGIGRVLQSEVPMFVDRFAALGQDLDARTLGQNVSILENQLRRMYARMNGAGAQLDSEKPEERYQAMQAYGIRSPEQVMAPETVSTVHRANEPAPEMLKPGSTTKAMPIPDAMQQEFEQFVVPKLGQINPQEYADYRVALDKKYGFGDTPDIQRKIYEQEADRLNAMSQQKRDINLRIPSGSAQATPEERAKAALVNSPVLGRGLATGAGFTGAFADELLPYVAAAASGTPAEDVRRQQAAIEAKHPLWAGAGRFAGSAAQVALTEGMAPGLYAKYGVPMTAGHMGIAGAASNPDEPVIGGITGVGLGLGLGAAAKPIERLIRAAPRGAVELGRRYGIPLTLSQLGESPSWRWIESKLAAVPGAGGGVRKRMEEGKLGFNAAAFDDALKPIGASTEGAIGHEGVAAADQAISNAYADTLHGVEIPVTDTFRNAVAQSVVGAGQVDAKYAKLLERDLAPFLNKDTLTGEDIQQVLQRSRAVSMVAKDDNGSAWKNYVLPHINAIENQTIKELEDVGLGEVATGLTKANKAYRGLNILADAVNAHADEAGIFTPKTLLGEVKSNVEAYEGSRALAKAGTQGAKDIPLFNLASKAANTKTGLLQAPTGAGLGVPAAATALGLSEAAAEHYLSPKDREGQPTADFGSAALRNALLLGGVGAATRAATSRPIQQLAQELVTRGAPAGRFGPLAAKYLGYAPEAVGRAASPAYTYRPPVRPEQADYGVYQVPLPQSDAAKLKASLNAYLNPPTDEETPSPEDALLFGQPIGEQ